MAAAHFQSVDAVPAGRGVGVGWVQAPAPGGDARSNVVLKNSGKRNTPASLSCLVCAEQHGTPTSCTPARTGPSFCFRPNSVAPCHCLHLGAGGWVRLGSHKDFGEQQPRQESADMTHLQRDSAPVGWSHLSSGEARQHRAQQHTPGSCQGSC